MAKIVGNTVGIPNPQPDWNQTDPAKADYIKNKPDYVKKEDGKGLSSNDFTDEDKQSIHTHNNKVALDEITQEKIDKWDNNTGGSVTPEQIQEAVSNYLEENPITEVQYAEESGYADEALYADSSGYAEEAEISQIANTAMVANAAEFDMYGHRFEEHYATKDELNKLNYIKVVSELPQTGDERYIYLVPNSSDEDFNIYDEYVWIEDIDKLNDGYWEHLGTKQIEIDLTGYATIEYVNDKIGDIETALDSIIAQQESIIAIQNALIGGES